MTMKKVPVILTYKGKKFHVVGSYAPKEWHGVWTDPARFEISSIVALDGGNVLDLTETDEAIAELESACVRQHEEDLKDAEAIADDRKYLLMKEKAHGQHTHY
jgi:hypothetical protein